MDEAKAEAINRAISRLDGIDKSVLARREIKYLPEVLSEGELPETICAGIYSGNWGILCATNKRLYFLDKGMVFGLKTETFSYDSITSVEHNSGLMFAKIKIYSSGHREEFSHIGKGEATLFVEYLREKILYAKAPAPPEPVPPALPPTAAPSPPPVEAPTNDSVVGELSRLADLLDRGIITRDEFDTLKAKVLSS